MNPANLLHDLDAVGAKLDVTDRNTIKMAGSSAVLEVWAPRVRRHKPELMSLLRVWADLESAIQACCEARGDDEMNRCALLKDFRSASATDWPWLAWYFRQKSARSTH